MEPVLSEPFDVVYTSYRNGNTDLYRFDSKTNEIIKLTDYGLSSSAQLSPDQQTIYYIASGDVFRMNKDGTNKINLTQTVANEYQFDISGDGSMIVFDSNRGKTQDALYHREIYVMNPDGSNQVQISQSQYYSIFPAFSADNTHIAYVSVYYEPVRFELHLFSLMDSSDTVLTPAGSSQAFPVFSPDGRYLSFYSRNDHQLGLMNLNTGKVKKLMWGKEQQFSADGHYLYFLTIVSGGLDIVRYEIATGEIQYITDSQGQENQFDIDPNQQRIVFSSDIEVQDQEFPQIFYKGIGSDTMTRLTHDVFENYDPIFVNAE